MKCPKCNSEARDIARFCPRCHMTLRYDCPSCHHEQRHGGTCDKCGVDFLKFVAAVVSDKKGEADALNDRFENRSTLLANILSVPITGGIPLFRQLFGISRKKRI